MKNTGRKLLCIILSLTVIVCFTGCTKTAGGEKSATETQLNLALREGTYSEVVKKGVTSFEEKYGITCNIFEYSETDLHDIVVGDKKSEDIDLYMVDGSWVAECVSKDRLLCLDDYGYSLDSDIISATTTISYMNKHLYVAPYFGNVTVLLYNKEALEETGYEESRLTSMDRLLRVCEKSKGNGRLGFLYRGDTNNNLVVDFLPILLSFGGWVIDEEGNPIVTSEEFQNAFLFYLDLIETGQAMEKEKLIQTLEDGEGTMAVGWPGWYSPTDLSPVQYCAIQGRAHESTVTYNAGVYGIWTLGISSGSKEAEHAIELLKYLMSEEVQRESVVYGGVPCRYSCLGDEDVIKSHPEFEAVCNALESGKYRPILAEWNDFCDILGEQMNRSIQGECEPVEALEEAQQQLEKLLKTKS